MSSELYLIEYENKNGNLYEETSTTIETVSITTILESFY
ncbi:Uncharacterised protein [Actinobacillus equuli]|nr:Uncharacterised protein [Actinobacillus equuli]